MTCGLTVKTARWARIKTLFVKLNYAGYIKNSVFGTNSAC